MAAEFAGFPYRRPRSPGPSTVEFTNDQTMTCDVDLTGDAAAGRSRSRAKSAVPARRPPWISTRRQRPAAGRQVFQALPELGPEDRAAIPAGAEPASRLQGGADGAGRRRGDHPPRAGKDFTNHYVIRFHDASVKYDLFPLALEKVKANWTCGAGRLGLP